MRVELAIMIQTISLWVLFFVFVLLLSRIIGVSGNQLIRVKNRLGKLKEVNASAISNVKEATQSRHIRIRTINKLAFITKRVIGNMDLYLFDHRDNKKVSGLKPRLEDLLKSYRTMLQDIKKGEEKNNYSSNLDSASKTIDGIIEDFNKEEEIEE